MAVEARKSEVKNMDNDIVRENPKEWRLCERLRGHYHEVVEH